MPSLDELFGALSTDADRVPAPELAAVRRRGRQRQVGRIVAAAAVAVLVLLAGTAIGARLIGAPPARPEPAGPVPAGFQRLEQVGPGVPFGPIPPGTTPKVATAIGDGRGYAAWTTDDGKVSAVAVDLGTGKPTWGPRPVGGHGPGGFVAFADGVLAVGAEIPGGSKATVTALDPATGQQLWQRDIDMNQQILLFPGVLVLVDYPTGLTRAYNWRTGAPTWAMIDKLNSVEYAIGLSTPADVAAGTADGLRFTDPRLVEADGDGQLRVYDPATGHLITTRPAPPGRQAIGFDGAVIVAGQRPDTGLRTVQAVDLAGGPVRELYRGTRPVSAQDLTMSPCGPSLCLVDATSVSGPTAADIGPGDPDAELVALDPHTGQVAWRRVTGDLATLIPVQDKVLGRRGGTIGLYGPDAGRILVAQDRGGLAVPVGGDRVLLLIPPKVENSGDRNVARPTDVSGLRADGGATGALGSIDIAPTDCSAGTGTLFCPTSTGLRVWRFGPA